MDPLLQARVFLKSSKMFKNTFQSGFLSILYSIGSKPLQIWEKKASVDMDLKSRFQASHSFILVYQKHLMWHEVQSCVFEVKSLIKRLQNEFCAS